jgi:D-alanyl-D-alanine carboxypeptidase
MRKTLTTAFLLLYLSTDALAQLATHPARAIFEQWLAAFNPSDSIAIKKFIEQYKLKYTLQDELDFRESVGQLEVLEVATPSGSDMTALVRGSESDSALLVTLTVEPTDPAQISTFRLEGTEVPERFKIPRLSLSETFTQARIRIASMLASKKLAGAILVAKGDRVLFSWANGVANRRTGTSIDTETRFRFASLGKMFTAVAVLQLVDARRLDLDDRIGKYIKGPALAAAAKQITIRQLLNHTSGLGDVFDENFQKNSGKLRSIGDYVSKYGVQPLAFEPGTQEKYSNFGYILLGAIIESASGIDYYEYVRRKILVPVHMRLTGFDPEVHKVKGLARPYTKENGQLVDAGPSLPWRGTPAGGGYSSAGDLLRFSRALQTGLLLSDHVRDIATKGQNLKGWYGFGFMVSGQASEARYGHEGGAPGMNAAFFVYPAPKYTVLGLGNLDPSSIGQVVNFIGNRLPIEQ